MYHDVAQGITLKEYKLWLYVTTKKKEFKEFDLIQVEYFLNKPLKLKV
jgi:hypothetical protein